MTLVDETLTRLIDRVDRLRASDDSPCACETTFVESPWDPEAGASLLVRSDDCPGGGDLVASPDCRGTVVDAVAERDVDALRVRVDGRDHRYVEGVGLFLAAGRFVERVDDAELAAVARRHPLRAARLATGRSDPAARLAATSGLAAALDLVPDSVQTTRGAYESLLRAVETLPVANAVVDPRVPDGATLQSSKSLSTGAEVETYDTDRGPYYHLRPVESTLDDDQTRRLSAAVERLAAGDGDEGALADETLASVLSKHTTGLGVLDDVFADDAVTDVFATAPVAATPLRVVADGERFRSNVRLTTAGAAALASRVRAESGRPFSRARPTVDATLCGSARVRVAGVADPPSDGYAFALRRSRESPWRLTGLVGNGTLTPAVGAFLSLAVERGVAGLVAGGRGAGKTTLLGALLWELPRSTRSVVVEDTPELPTEALRSDARDVQRLAVRPDEDDAFSPTDAVRTALRLGDGALVVGEVRGREARALYEAMRVGSADGAVLGTVHGRDEDAVRERVVTDLGVPASSFASTDLVVVLDSTPTRHVSRVVEVRATDDGPTFAPLYVRDGGTLVSTGVLERGESALLAGVTGDAETYGDVLDSLADRTSRLREATA